MPGSPHTCSREAKSSSNENFQKHRLGATPYCTVPCVSFSILRRRDPRRQERTVFHRANACFVLRQLPKPWPDLDNYADSIKLTPEGRIYIFSAVTTVGPRVVSSMYRGRLGVPPPRTPYGIFSPPVATLNRISPVPYRVRFLAPPFRSTRYRPIRLPRVQMKEKISTGLALGVVVGHTRRERRPAGGWPHHKHSLAVDRVDFVGEPCHGTRRSNYSSYCSTESTFLKFL